MFEVLAAVLTALVSYFLWRRYKLFQVLWEAGHVGPRGNFISGMYYEITRHGSHNLFDTWFKKYNRDTVGFYYGSQPFLVTKNVDLAKQIIIKDFQKFRNRTQTARLEASHPVIGSHLLFASDERWKRTRNFMTPSFSTVNMREMYLRLTKCMDSFMANMDQSPSDSINIYALVRRLTLDNIARAGFSIATDVQKNVFETKPKFQIAAENSFDYFGSMWLNPVAQMFKPLGQFLFVNMRKLGLVEHPQDPMIKYMEEFIKMRESAPKPEGEWVDFMQNIINGGKGEAMDSRQFHKNLGFKLTRDEVVGSCLLFFLAAFETTSSALSFVLYALAQDAEVQNRLRRELKSTMNDEGCKVDYDLIMNHRYLDMVVNEGLRLYPTANGFVGREAVEDYEYKGIKIPAGVDILFSAYDMHRDPANFPDPEKFDPERFSPERKGQIPSMAFLPFGEGQRMCVGNRFALMQMKLAVARLVLKYDMTVDASKHDKPVEVIDRAFLLFQPGSGIYVKLSEV